MEERKLKPHRIHYTISCIILDYRTMQVRRNPASCTWQGAWRERISQGSLWPGIWYLACILGSLFFIVISPTAAAPLPVYEYWTDENYPPFEFKDASGNAAGFSVDIMRAIGREVGFEVNATPHPWSEVKSALENKTIHLSGTMAYDINRTDRFAFSVPIIVLNWHLYVPESSSITSLEELKGKRIVIAKGDIWEEKLAAEHFPADIIIVADYREQLHQLAAGGFDAAIINKPVASYLIEDEGIRGIKPSGPAVSRMKLCIASPRSDPALINLINEGIVIINRNGTFDEISDTWFAPAERDEISAVYRQILFYVLLPILLIIGLILFWNRSLQRVVTARTADLERELTARTKAEEARAISERRYTLTLEAINDGLWDYDVRSESLFVSPQLFRMGGYEPGEMEATVSTWISLVHPEDRARVSEEFIRTRTTGVSYAEEYRVQKKDGTYFWILARGRVVEADAEGRPLRIVGIHSDITARRMMEDSLEKQRRTMQTLMDNLSGMVYRCKNDEHWSMELVSDKVYALTGYHREEILNNRVITYAQIIHPDDREFVQNKVTQAIEQSHPFTLQYRIVHREGNVRWVWEQGRGIIENGNLLALEGYITDITEETQAEQKLKKMGYSIEHLREGVFWFDENGSILDANIAFSQIFGVEEEQIMGLAVSSLPVVWKSQTWPALREKAEVSGFVAADAILSPGTEQVRYLRISLSHVIFGDENIFCGIVNDRTREETYLQEVLRSKEELSAAFEELVAAEESLQEQVTQLQEVQTALKRSERNYRSIFEDAILGIFQVSPEGHIIEINQAFARMYGYQSPDEMKDARITISQVYSDPQAHTMLMKMLRENGEVRGFEAEGVRCDGASIWISMNEKTVFDEDGKILSYEGTIEDITRRRQAEAEREVALRQVRKNLAELSILNDGIRNPLTVIAIIAEASEPAIAEQIAKEIRRIDDLIKELDKRWMESDKVIHFLQKHHGY